MHSELVTKLSGDFPELIINNLRLIGEGWDNTAVLVNNNIVFRVPKNLPEHLANITREHTKVEIKTLSRLREKLPVIIPVIQYVASDKSYYGYNYIPGDKLSSDGINNIEDFVNLWIDTSVAISTLIGIDEAKSIGIETFPFNDYRLRRINEVVNAGILNNELTSLAKDASKNYMELGKQSTKGVVHGDLGLGNWLYDRDTNSYAVIDWSDICIAPQEFQMYRLINDLPDYTELVINRYYEETGQRINKQLLFTCGSVSILSVIGELIGNADTKADLVKAKISQLSDWRALQTEIS
ncbi:MAG: hypothetical protein NVSMB46_04180 [Candidatus Saccharimonadales bacterium]